jgi:hypothetical protein
VLGVRVFVASLAFVEFHDETCTWILCMSLVYMSNHFCGAHTLFHALEVELICFNSKFSYISTHVVIYYQKGGDCNHLGPFTPLVRVCFGDK